MLQNIYGAPSENETRYSPAICIGCDMKVVSGKSWPETRQHQLRWTTESTAQDAKLPIYQTDERF